MPDEADKQKRWMRAIYMNGFAAGHALCGKVRMELPDQVALDLSTVDTQEAFEIWGLNIDELRAAQSYMIELHDINSEKGGGDA